MSFLTASGELAVNNAMDQLHYFFAKKGGLLYAVKDGQTTIVSEDPNHNFYYDDAPNNTEVVTTRESGAFYARTYFLNGAENFNSLNYPNNSQDLEIKTADNILKIITDSTGKSLLEDTDKISWKDSWWEKDSTPANHGLLQKNFFTYYFQEIK